MLKPKGKNGIHGFLILFFQNFGPLGFFHLTFPHFYSFQTPWFFGISLSPGPLKRARAPVFSKPFSGGTKYFWGKFGYARAFCFFPPPLGKRGGLGAPRLEPGFKKFLKGGCPSFFFFPLWGRVGGGIFPGGDALRV